MVFKLIPIFLTGSCISRDMIMEKSICSFYEKWRGSQPLVWII